MSTERPEPNEGRNDGSVPAELASMLVGTWSYPADEEPSGTGYIHFSENGRAYQFPYDKRDPELRPPMRLWYSVESAFALRVRPKNNPEGWLVQFRFDNESLILTNPKREFRCVRTVPEEVPPWFVDRLGRWLEKS